MLGRQLNSTRGEIALTFTVASLFVMVVGSIFGLGVNKSQDVRSQAAGAVCGKTCSVSGDCGTDSTTGTLTTCDRSIGKCVAVRDPKNPPCNATGPNSLGQCNQSCKNTEQCNGIDHATDISLACDLSSGTCQQKYVNDTRQCPGYVRPTPRTGGSSGSTSGSFTSRSLVCGAAFRVVVDPLINKITLSAKGQSYDIGLADVVVPASSGFTGPNSPIPYRMWKPAPNDPLDNLLIEWNPNTSYTAPGVPKGALHVQVRSGNDANPHSKVNPQVDFYYFRNLPTWLKDGSPVIVTFSYYTLSGAQSKQVRTDYTITENAKACVGVVVTPPPFSTLAPTIITPSVVRPTGITPTVVAPSRTPSVPPTNPPTRVPSRTPSVPPSNPPTQVPSRVPTPPSCSAKITFMIDASNSTQQILEGYAGKIEDAVKTYGDNPLHANDTLELYTQFFARDVFPKSGPTTLKTFSFPVIKNKHWTNIKAALEATTDYTIFISDGIPSVVQYGSKNNASSLCVYPNGDYMRDGSNKEAEGCRPNIDQQNVYAKSGCEAVCNQNSYTNARNDSMIKSNKSKTYGIFVNTGISDRSFIEDVSKEVIDVADVPATIEEIFNDVCGRAAIASRPRTGSGRSTGPGNSGPQSLTSTFVITNQSTEKTVESVSVKACDVAGNNCQTYDNEVLIVPGATGRFSQTIPAEVPAQNRAMITCDVNNDDGSSISCPQKVTNDDGIRFELSVVDEEVTGDSISFEKAADINKDGQVRANDYALCLVGNSLCDIIADESDEVNALDRSVVYERLMKSGT